jgi:hypothetical protein
MWLEGKLIGINLTFIHEMYVVYAGRNVKLSFWRRQKLKTFANFIQLEI